MESMQDSLTRCSGVGDNYYTDDQPLARICGHSSAIVEVRQQIRLCAAADTSVLVYGETGTGKELVARALHALSRRAQRPFVAINCGAYPNELILNELFGHERGAFTGAQARQEGLISQAQGGTLFLDEIDSLSPAAQVLLLRFIQERCFRPLGSGKESHADVRIIAATHCDLQERISESRFRDDLFYRLDVLRIQLPPLRERCEDILPLAHSYWRKVAEQHQLYANPLTAAFEHWLQAYHWPGNVRELENVITRWVFGQKPASMTSASDPGADYWQAHYGSAAGTLALTFSQAKELVISQFEKHYIASILALTKGNITQAALKAGKERRAFGRLARKHNLV